MSGFTVKQPLVNATVAGSKKSQRNRARVGEGEKKSRRANRRQVNREALQGTDTIRSTFPDNQG